MVVVERVVHALEQSLFALAPAMVPVQVLVTAPESGGVTVPEVVGVEACETPAREGGGPEDERGHQGCRAAGGRDHGAPAEGPPRVHGERGVGAR